MAEHGRGQCGQFEAAMEVLAKPWTGFIIMTLEAGPLRFRELGDRVGTIGDRMLALRLKDLEARGLVVRRVAARPPVRVEYGLTDVGRGFHDVAGAVQRWGEMILAAQAAAPKPAARARTRVGAGSG